MQGIDIERWERTPEDPKMLKYVGQRTGQEVFAELEYRLKTTGFLPDEYFLLDSYWEDGKEIPKGTAMFSTTDYGSSEGIYIDVYFKWYDQQQSKSVTQNFITGKTLGETEMDLDRMYLIASAITKCFHTDGVHARYIRIGEPEQSEGCVLHLDGNERRTLLDSLICTHNRLTEKTLAVENLIRRVSSSITGYINELGRRPMNMNDFDTATLAIVDGCLSVFKGTYLNTPDRLGELLVYAAARPGNVGKVMISLILNEAKEIPNDIYFSACKYAIETGDAERTVMLVKQAAESRAENELTIYGDLIHHAFYVNKRKVAQEIVKLCTPEMIAAADPYILPQAIQSQDYEIAHKLIENGIDANRVASDFIHALVYRCNNRFYFEYFLNCGMVIDNNNFSAMRACIRTESPEQGKLLIDRGMDFDLYLGWSEMSNNADNTGVTFDEIKAHWENRGEIKGKYLQ